MSIAFVTISGGFEWGDQFNDLLTEYSAFTVPALKRANDVYSGTLATLPIYLVDGSGVRQSHYLLPLLNHAPNPWIDATTSRATLYTHKSATGNGFQKINRKGNRIDSIVTVCPEQVIVRVDSRTGEPLYSVDGEPVHYGDIIHLRGTSWNGITGLPVGELERRTVEALINAEKLAATFLKKGYHLSGVIEFPAGLKEEQREALQKSWQQQYEGMSNTGKVPVLPYGAVYKPLSVNARDSQLIETRQFLISEVARLRGIPPTMLYELSRGTWSNIADLGAEVIRFTFRNAVEATEEEYRLKLLTDEEKAAGFTFQMDLSAIARGNYETLVATENTLGTNGYKTDNQVLKALGLEPYDGGDTRRNPSHAMKEGSTAPASNEDKTNG